MSLLHRASSSDSLSRRYSAAAGNAPEGRDRRLSFNPVGEWVPPVAERDPITAYEVPHRQKILQVAAAVVYCLFAAGIVFGYAAIKPVLIREGVYRDRCTREELEKNVPVCYNQEIRLNLMFTIAAVATNVCALPIGTILDRYGPRVCGLMSVAFMVCGCLFFAFASDIKGGFDGYIAGYFFLALGGPFVFISSFQLSNAFPRYSGLILALITCSFDTSSAMFLFYRLIYTATNGSFVPKKFFLIYLVVPAFILVVQLFLMPARSYKTVSELVKHAEDETNDVHSSDDEMAPDERESVRKDRRFRRESAISEITSLLGSKLGCDEAEQAAKHRAQSGVWGALHGRTATQQVLTPWFVLITLFTVVQMCRINYFVATVRPQYAYYFNSWEKAIVINSFFDVALPLGGVLSIPFIGMILDNTSTPFVLGLLVTIATTIGILGILPYTWAAYANISLFVLYRPFYYTTVSDYAAKVFGFETFGKVYGLIICLAGIFNFMQTPLDALTHKTFNNNPTPVNVLLLSVAVVVGICLVGYVTYQSRQMNRQELEDEAETADVSRMPGAENTPDMGRASGGSGGYGING